MKNKLLMAAIDSYQAQKTEALAHLDILFNDAVGIGEHTDLLTEVKKWTESLLDRQSRRFNLPLPIYWF